MPDLSLPAPHEDGGTVLRPSFGRQLRLAREALESVHRLFVVGVWGSGRTTLLRELVRTRTDGETAVLLSPVEGDQERPWSGLAQLLAQLPRDLLAPLPRSRQSVLKQITHEYADPGNGNGPDALAVRLAVAELLATDRDSRWLLAVDDGQWLDAGSADVVRYAAQTLAPGRFRTAVAVRTGLHPTAGYRVTTEHAPRITLGMLTLEETALYLESRGERAATASAVHRDSGGHPLLVRSLTDELNGGPDRDPSAVRDSSSRPIRELAAAWLATVTEDVRDTLTRLALAHAATRLEVRRTWPDSSEAHLACALDAGILVTPDGDRLVFAAQAVRSEAAGGAGRLARDAHRALAATTPDPVHAARHRLLSEDRPGSQVLKGADEAASQARIDGDRALAADILLAAAERTPSGQRQSRLSRLVAAAQDAGAAGRADQALRAARALAVARAGECEATALLAVVDASGQELDGMDEVLLRARHLARGNAAVLAAVDLRSAVRHNLGGRPGEARQAALRAVREASAAQLPALTAAALTMQARIERITEHPGADRTLSRALAVVHDGTDLPLRDTARYLAARHALFDDRLAEAGAALMELLPPAEASGSAEDLQEVLRSLAELEVRRGSCARALHWSERALAVGRDAGLSLGPAWYTCAMTAMAGSSFDEAVRYARLGALVSREAGDLVFTSRNLLALGTAELVTGQPGQAVKSLGRVAELERLQQVRDVTMLRWHPELIEALAACGRHEEAAQLLTTLRVMSSAQALATGWGAGLDRAEAVHLAHTARKEEAVALVERAGERFGELGLRLEEGRTHLALARIERGRRRGAAARHAAERAAALFEDTGARPWSALAHGLLRGADDAGAERAGPDPLTAMERKVADVVMSGASNKETAQQLFLSVKTVEATLSRVYRKLAVRSRSQLAAALHA
ncbi:helix-turn-helix transcriptional regulator [Streptomyces beijiangensis]|uniref:Helix-turn-helix domain-containing protein n=1 Tax=Streptomyces beijiangensis TaxID=163361 RepID=A0A939F8C0_9ACTN|nr:LuxR family transcriptional regulator [Streptomyces beijiangensis]MBO0513907.1 helix-turn-helix domain-containing protein [Streptomyces beijiangensis]